MIRQSLVIGNRHTPSNNQGILINAIQGFSTERNNAIDAAPSGESDFNAQIQQLLLGGVGFSIETYPYYDFKNHRIDFDAMLSRLHQALVDVDKR